jgi:SAM-dependent methyltransferase
MIKECVACGDERTHELRALEMANPDARYRMAVCASCGLKSSHPMPGAEELRDWYGATIPPFVPRLARIRKVLNYFHDRHMVALLARYVPSGTLVDVGAGRGRFLRAARREGRWTMMATEYSAEALQILKADGVHAVAGTLDELGLADESVDAVWASHVIEHLPDPESFFASVRRVLKPDGVLVALVPTQTSMRARLNLTNWHHVNPPGHLWSFNPETFRKTLQTAGFELLHIEVEHLICEMVCVVRKRSSGR